jgi:hypothetical protein
LAQARAFPDRIRRNQPAIAFFRIEPYHRGGFAIFRRIPLPIDRRIPKQQRAASASAAQGRGFS